MLRHVHEKGWYSGIFSCRSILQERAWKECPVLYTIVRTGFGFVGKWSNPVLCVFVVTLVWYQPSHSRVLCPVFSVIRYLVAGLLSLIARMP